MARYVPDELKIEILEQADLLDLMRSYGIPDKEHGNIRCPFPDHDDNTPSFSVFKLNRKDLSKPIHGWKCYGCEKGGDVISFLENYKGMDFYDAAKEAAEFARIDFDGEMQRIKQEQREQRAAKNKALRRRKARDAREDTRDARRNGWKHRGARGGKDSDKAPKAPARGVNGEVRVSYVKEEDFDKFGISSEGRKNALEQAAKAKEQKAGKLNKQAEPARQGKRAPQPVPGHFSRSSDPTATLLAQMEAEKAQGKESRRSEEKRDEGARAVFVPKQGQLDLHMSGLPAEPKKTLDSIEFSQVNLLPLIFRSS